MPPPLQNNNRYVLSARLGTGASSTVWQGYDQQLRRDVAIKVFLTFGDKAGMALCREEYQNTVRLQHENIIKPFDFGEWGREAYIVMPYYRLGSLQERIGLADEPEIWRIIRDICSALAYLHAQQPPLLHSDLKPDNFLVAEDGRIILSDFGISAQLHDYLLKTNVTNESIDMAFKGRGPDRYRAPELFNFKGQERTAPIKASEMWALGASLYHIAMGEAPFGKRGGMDLLVESMGKPQSPDRAAELRRIGQLVRSLPSRFSPRLEQAILACLCAPAWQRPTAQELFDLAQTQLSLINKTPIDINVAAAPAAPNPITYSEENQEDMYHQERQNKKDPTLLIILVFVFIIGSIGFVIYQITKKPDPVEDTGQNRTNKDTLLPDKPTDPINKDSVAIINNIAIDTLTKVKEEVRAQIRNQDNSRAQHLGCVADLISIQKRIENESNIEKIKECFCQEGDDCSFVTSYKKRFKCENRRYGVQIGASLTEENAMAQLMNLAEKHHIHTNDMTIVRKKDGDVDKFLVVRKAKSMKELKEIRDSYRSIEYSKPIQFEERNGIKKYEKALQDVEIARYKE